MKLRASITHPDEQSDDPGETIASKLNTSEPAESQQVAPVEFR
jgi:hypothetical protein